MPGSASGDRRAIWLADHLQMVSQEPFEGGHSLAPFEIGLSAMDVLPAASPLENPLANFAIVIPNVIPEPSRRGLRAVCQP